MEISQVSQLIPELALIRDEGIREKSAAIIAKLITAGGWDEKGIEKCPLELEGALKDFPMPLIKFMRMLTDVAEHAYRGAGQWADEKLGCDHDTVVAGALLQAAGKFSEYDLDSDGNPCYSRTGRMFRHPSAAAWHAQEAGLPERLVHIILVTSGKYSPLKGEALLTPELLFVRNTNMLCLSVLKSLLHKRG